MERKKAKFSLSESNCIRAAIAARILELQRKIVMLSDFQGLAELTPDDRLLLDSWKIELSTLEEAKKKLFYFTSVSL